MWLNSSKVCVCVGCGGCGSYKNSRKRIILLAEMDKEDLKEVWDFYSDLKMQVGVCWEG